MKNSDSFESMMTEVQAFHDKHRFNQRGGEDMVYRVTLMAEELGEISACVTKGKPKPELAEECADLMILLLGNAIAADFDLAAAFWKKMEKINQRGSRIVDGRIRVSNFSASNQASEHGRSGHGQSEQGHSEQGHSEQGQSEQGQSEQGQSEPGQSEPGPSGEDL